jgi:IS4 transposase
VECSAGSGTTETVLLTSQKSADLYPEKIRRVGVKDPETSKAYTFLTNDFTLSGLTVAQLYKSRGQVEIFFKWIKQHLRIKAFYGRSINAVKTQIWIAISVYVTRRDRAEAARNSNATFTLCCRSSVSVSSRKCH